MKGQMILSRPVQCTEVQLSVVHQVEYTNWKDLKYSLDPWRKIDNLPLSLLRKVLMPLPSKRYSLGQIQNHIWMKKTFKEGEQSLLRSNSGSGLLGKRLCSGLDHKGQAEHEVVRESFSQPMIRQDSGQYHRLLDSQYWCSM